MGKLIILRGPSGSGKSSIANHLRVDRFGDISTSWFEADHFFGMGEDYNFDASKLGQAHGWCKAQVRARMDGECDQIIVSNTSMTNWEMKPYLELAEEYGYELEILRTPGPWEADILFQRNVHGVPLGTLQKQIRGLW